MKGRIDRLESLVRAMISGDSNAEYIATPLSKNSSHVTDGQPPGVKPLSPLSLEDQSSPRSQIDIGGIPGGLNASTDSRSTHWDVILNDVSGPKQVSRQYDQTSNTRRRFVPSRMLGVKKTVWRPSQAKL